MGVPLGGVEWSGISWHLRICRLLCHSVALSAQCACHSVASSGMAMRQGVYGAAQGPSKRQATPNGSVTAMAPSLPAKRNTLTRLREFVWVGGCVTARAAWPSPLGRRRRSVHRLAKMASRRRFGAFVYTVATRGLCERRWGRRSVHRSAKMASRRRFGAFVYTVVPWAWVVGGLGIAIVYTNGRIGPLRTGLGHLCTLLRRELRRESRRELPAPGGTSASTTMACRRRLLACPSRLVGKTGSERVAPLPGWHLRQGVNPHGPLKSHLNVVFDNGVRPSALAS